MSFEDDELDKPITALGREVATLALTRAKEMLESAEVSMPGSAADRARYAREFVRVANLACTVFRVQTPDVEIGRVPTVSVKEK